MTESTIYTHNKVYSYLTSYLIAAGTTEVVLDLSAAHRASKVCVRCTSTYVCTRGPTRALLAYEISKVP